MNTARSLRDPHARVLREAEFRFYAELNDFLSPADRQRSFTYAFTGTPSVKDTIEAIGVPHTEVDVIFVDDQSVDFHYLLRGGERVAVYPVFERFGIERVTRLRPAPLRVTRFIADVHLGALARRLRLLGFDTTWERDLADEEIIRRAADEQRIVLTRDKGILKHNRVTHAYWVRSTDPDEQLEELVRAIDLAEAIHPYSRCTVCNGELVSIPRWQAATHVPLQVFIVYRDFRRCGGCRRVYWRGSHTRRLENLIARVSESSYLQAETPGPH